ncbi:uncharacterized protein LOC129716691 [Wyeomyia smithii]|uniref:uncharacterized protein LOC129716691 n=1 Tax=Wyeomyia smithii TaxID=174621 RepID=UPI002467F161|nr:uncharacterized protein LOC129716691 [Wyeomyia smithii]
MEKKQCGECKQAVNDIEPIRCGFCENCYHINQQCCGFNSRGCKDLFALGDIMFICPICRELLNGRSIRSYIADLQLPLSEQPTQSSQLTELPAQAQKLFEHTGQYSNAVWLFYQNVRGLRTKIDEFYLATNDCNFDVIVLTETGLDDRINSQQLFGDSFNVFRCDRSVHNRSKRSFGGVLIVVNKRYPSALFNTSHGNHLEQICVGTTICGLKIFLCAVYIPPDESNDPAIIDAHIASVTELCSKRSANDTILVCGDFNQPRIVWSQDKAIHTSSSQFSAASAALIDGMDFLNLSQVNQQLNHLDRMLDLIFCPIEQTCVVDTCVAPLVPVDLHHPPLVISLPSESRMTTPVSAADSMRTLNYRKINFTALTEFLQSFDWMTLYEINDVDDLANSFSETLCQWLRQNLPLVNKPASPPWATPRLHALKRVRNAWQRKYRKTKTVETKCNYKRSSTDFRRMNACLYKSYVMRVQTDLRRNPKQFWNFVNSKRKCSLIPSSSMFPGVVTASELDAEIASADVPLDLVDLSTFEITADMIVTAAKRLKTSFYVGPDGIPAVVYTRCAAVLAGPL